MTKRFGDLSASACVGGGNGADFNFGGNISLSHHPGQAIAVYKNGLFSLCFSRMDLVPSGAGVFVYLCCS